MDDSDADGAFCALKPPIFVIAADGEVLVYASVDAATRGLESPDVEAGEYPLAFDADGTRLVLEVVVPTKRRRFLGVETLTLTPVTLRTMSSPGEGAAELARILAAELEEFGGSPDLKDLVERMAGRQPIPSTRTARK